MYIGGIRLCIPVVLIRSQKLCFEFASTSEIGPQAPGGVIVDAASEVKKTKLFCHISLTCSQHYVICK